MKDIQLCCKTNMPLTSPNHSAESLKMCVKSNLHAYLELHVAKQSRKKTEIFKKSRQPCCETKVAFLSLPYTISVTPIK